MAVIVIISMPQYLDFGLKVGVCFLTLIRCFSLAFDFLLAIVELISSTVIEAQHLDIIQSYQIEKSFPD